MSQFWILTVADAEYSNHVEDTRHFISHSNAVKCAKEILLEHDDEDEQKKAIDEFVASIKDGEAVDKIVGDSNIVIKSMTLLDRTKYTVVDPKSVWSTSVVGTNCEPTGDAQYFVHRENAAMAAEQLFKETLDDFKQYVDDNIDITGELEKFTKSFLATAADSDFVYNDELLDEFSNVVERVRFADLI